MFCACKTYQDSQQASAAAPVGAFIQPFCFDRLLRPVDFAQLNSVLPACPYLSGAREHNQTEVAVQAESNNVLLESSIADCQGLRPAVSKIHRAASTPEGSSRQELIWL